MLRWVLFFALLFPLTVFASENCVEQFKGVCRDSCGTGETPAEGAFIDCAEKQECCVRSAASGNTGPAEAPSVRILINGSAFTPDSLTVLAGTEVIWKNNDSAPHTVTANDGSFDSGTMSQGGEFRKKFTTPGVFSYSCDVHPYMEGKIEVRP